MHFLCLINSFIGLFEEVFAQICIAISGSSVVLLEKAQYMENVADLLFFILKSKVSVLSCSNSAVRSSFDFRTRFSSIRDS